MLPVLFTISSVQSLSHVWLFETPWTAACQVSLSITNSRTLLKFTSIESVMPSDQLILCRPLLLWPSIFPSTMVFSKESVLCISWLKYCSFSFSISASNDHAGLISFRIDWFDLLAVQGTLKSLVYYDLFLFCSSTAWTYTHTVSVFLDLSGSSILSLDGYLML